MNKKTIDNLLQVRKIKEEYETAVEFESQLRENPMTERQFANYVLNSDMSPQERAEMMNKQKPYLQKKGLIVADTPPTFQEFKENVKNDDPKMFVVSQSVLNQMNQDEYNKLMTVRFTVFNDAPNVHYTYEYIDRFGVQKTAGTPDGLNSKGDSRTIDLRTASDILKQNVERSIDEGNKARLEIPSYLRQIEENRDNLHPFAPVKTEPAGV